MPTGLYIHIPFCLTRCDFCAFYLRIYREADAERFLQGLAREINLHADRGTLSGRPLQTVYFGGGTPSVLGADRLCSVLAQIARRFELAPDAEVTIEAHPDEVDAGFAAGAAIGGCTRLSLGAQSFDAAELQKIGRPGMPDAVAAAVEHARRAGIRSVNLDLMFGLPDQDVCAWDASLDAALALEPDHLSCYAFTVEDGTQTARDVASARLMAPLPESQRALDALTASRLAAAGYERYEISNYARAGHQCRHNVLYWTGGDYLGLGPSAQSYVDGSRFGVIANLDRYCTALEHGELAVADSERLSERQRAVEAIVFGLRRLDGVETALVDSVCRTDATWERTFAGLLRDGLLERAAERVRLTTEGIRFADTVAAALI